MGLEGVTTYFDDIIIHGESIPECKNRLIACLERLKKYDLHINKAKCQFFKKSISYLGYVIEENKIFKCPKKVEAIIHSPKPQNVDDVKRFLGMITYYSRFLPDISTLTYPLRCLLKKNTKFNWSTSCESAFVRLKNEIASDRVLIPYDTLLPITVACDASPTGISGVLSHIVNNIEKPVAFASRSLTVAEQNYSQLDREALAIKFAVQKFHTYIYGKEFTLITDNKPLSRIFHHDSKIPVFTSSRLLRYATFLSEYNYKVQHRKSEDHANADYFSRSSIKLRDPKILQEDDIIHLQTVNQISTSIITAESIAKETEKDPKLSALKRELLLGSNYDTDFSLQDGIIFKGHRIFIPEIFRHTILRELHSTHIGMTKMKQLARRYVHWEKINQDIEHLVKSCEECAKLRNNPPKVVVHPWDNPEANWERIHIDYAGPFFDQYFLICVDAKSKWLEIRISKSAPSTSSTINLLKDIFSTHGFPEVLVSDNASIFTSEEFRTFCTACGIFQKFIAPGHPATNGLAERNVQTFKRRLKSVMNEAGTLTEKIRKILFRYRATPLACGKSPAELYLNRKIRIELDAFLPNSHQRRNSVIEPVRTLSKGERVQARVHQNNSEIWLFGVVIRKLGSRHYLVKLDTGRIFKRHINQLVSTRVPEKHIYPSKETDSSKSPKHVTFMPEKTISNDNSTPSRNDEFLTERRFQKQTREPLRNPSTSGDHSAVHKPSDNSVSSNLPTCRRSGRIRRPPQYLSDYVK